MDNIKFLRRRQFVLGPETFDLPGWHYLSINSRYVLSHHNDLNVVQIKDNNKALTLLGFIIDPMNPKFDNKEILSKMLKFNSLDEIITFLKDKSGRFIVIINIDNKLYLLNDPGALRQVVYHIDSNGVTWCASQSDLIANKLNIKLNNEAIEFINSKNFKYQSHEYWLMNDLTWHINVRMLLPNHYLDIINGKIVRFWPKDEYIIKYGIDEAINLSNRILIGSIEAITRRFNCKMGISAGIDSRRMLAASKTLIDKITFFSIYHKNKPMDVIIPLKLAKKLGLFVDIVPFKEMDDAYCDLYKRSIPFGRISKGNIGYSLYKKFGSEIMVITGNAGEITQCNYWLPKWKLDGEGLAAITGQYHPMAIREYEKWIRNNFEVSELTGINILTLFHWEQRVGRWVATSFSEYDIAHESFTPYMNRNFIMYLLGVKERYRKNRMFFIPKKQIKSLWCEVLTEPINPGDSISGKIMNILRRNIFHKFITPWVPVYEFFVFCKRYVSNRFSYHKKK